MYLLTVAVVVVVAVAVVAPYHTKARTHSVGLLWTRDRLAADTSTWQHTTHETGMLATGGIRTRDPSKLAAAESRLRPRGHWDRLADILQLNNSDWLLVRS